MKNLIISNLNTLIDEVKEKQLSEHALQSNSLFNEINEELQNGSYTILDISEFGTTLDSITSTLGSYIHYWGMNASGGDEEDKEARNIQNKFENLYYKREYFLSYITELNSKTAYITILEKTLDEISNIAWLINLLML